MLTITNKVEPRHLPPDCTIKISLVSADVAAMLIKAEPKTTCVITDMETLERVKKDTGINQFTMEQFKKRYNHGEKILHVTFYKPKVGTTGQGKTEYRMMTLESI